MEQGLERWESGVERGWLGRGGRGFGEDEEDGRVKPWARGGEAGRPELGY